MMRLILFIMSLLLFIFIYPTFGQAKIGVSANNAVLMEQTSGRVLYEKKAHDIQSIASITKIMTAIIAIESGKMDETAKTSRRAIYTGGSSIYLEQGEKMMMEDLVYGLMLRSGNDAAVAIGEHVGGSVEGFVYLMNEKAQWLGMTNTLFDNPHGLDSDYHYSTAYDMALLMRYAMDNEKFSKITGTTSHKAKSRSYAWQNKNKLMTQFYENSTGGKTGFTKKSGRTLVTTAQKNKLDLIAVTLNAPDDWRDHMQMFEWGFKNYELKSIGEKGEMHYSIEGSNDSVLGYLHRDINYPLTKDEKIGIKNKSYLLRKAMELEEGIIGKKVFLINSTPITEVPIFAKGTNKVETNKKFGAEVFKNIQKIIGLN